QQLATPKQSQHTPLTRAISSAEASSATTRTSQSALTIPSMLSGQTRTTSRRSSGGTASSSYPPKYTSKTSSPQQDHSERRTSARKLPIFFSVPSNHRISYTARGQEADPR